MEEVDNDSNISAVISLYRFEMKDDLDIFHNRTTPKKKRGRKR